MGVAVYFLQSAAAEHAVVVAAVVAAAAAAAAAAVAAGNGSRLEMAEKAGFGSERQLKTVGMAAAGATSTAGVTAGAESGASAGVSVGVEEEGSTVGLVAGAAVPPEQGRGSRAHGDEVDGHGELEFRESWNEAHVPLAPLQPDDAP